MKIKSGALHLVAIFTLPVVFAFVCESNLVAQGVGSVSWSSKLNLKGIDEIPARLRAPVTAEHQSTPMQLTMTNGTAAREVANCEDYLSAIDSGFSVANNLSNKEAAPFVEQCYVLRDLQNAHATSSTNTYSWTGQSLTNLPPILVVGERSVSDEAEQAEKQGRSWQQFDPTLRTTMVTPDLLEATDGSYSYSLQILARGSFDANGTEDIAVYGCAVGQHSSWFQCKYFVFAVGSDSKLTRLTDRAAPYRLKVTIPK